MTLSTAVINSPQATIAGVVPDNHARLDPRAELDCGLLFTALLTAITDFHKAPIGLRTHFWRVRRSHQVGAVGYALFIVGNLLGVRIPATIARVIIFMTQNPTSRSPLRLKHAFVGDTVPT